MPKESNNNNPHRKNILFYDADQSCIDWLKDRYGLTSDTQALRLLLRLWRDLVLSGIISDDTPQVKDQIAHSRRTHGPRGQYRHKIHHPDISEL